MIITTQPTIGPHRKGSSGASVKTAHADRSLTKKELKASMREMVEPYFDNGVVRLYNANCRAMDFLEDASVDCVVTSPPYWGLRDYGLEPSVWDAQEGCEHVWGGDVLIRQTTDTGSGLIDHRSPNGPRQNNARRGTAYEVSQGAFCSLCGAWRGNLGLEPTPELYVQHLVHIFREVRRVLKDTGTVWLNLGDSYAGSGAVAGGKQKQSNVGSGGRWDGGQATTERRHYPPSGLKEKDLCGLPWRVAFALQADGWWFRSDIIWAKPNPMPESVTDRPTRSHEYLFLLTKSQRYYYDNEAVREIVSGGAHLQGKDGVRQSSPKTTAPGQGIRDNKSFMDGWQGLPDSHGRNRRSVWTIATQPFAYERCQSCHRVFTSTEYRRLGGGGTPRCETDIGGDDNCGSLRWAWEDGQASCLDCEATYSLAQFKKLPKSKICSCGEVAWSSHFATFPEALVAPCILAGTSEYGNCAKCGKPWERVMEKERHFESGSGRSGNMPTGKNGPNLQGGGETRDVRRGPVVATQTTGWQPACACGAPVEPAIVLDVFAGSGTVGAVAQRLGRRAVLIELSEAYCDLAKRRLEDVPLPLGVLP